MHEGVVVFDSVLGQQLDLIRVVLPRGRREAEGWLASAEVGLDFDGFDEDGFELGAREVGAELVRVAVESSIPCSR